MKVSHERVNAVLSAMKEEALSAAGSGQRSRYSFAQFCEEHEIFDGSEVEKNGSVLISCPFHSDSTASCYLNDGMWSYNCFGCRGGNFMNFAFRYQTEVLGSPISWSQFVNQELSKDPALMSRLGFNTIYVKEEQRIQEMSAFKPKRFKSGKVSNETYLTTVDKFLKRNPSVEEKKMYILLMQRGVPVQKVLKELNGESSEDDAKAEYDLSKMDVWEE